MKQKIKKKGNNVTDETKLEKKMFQKYFKMEQKILKKCFRCNIFFQTLCYYILEEV